MDNVKIKDGIFYFVNDQYYVDFPDINLMKNKELIGGIEHNRPSFYSIVDSRTGLYWLIPYHLKWKNSKNYMIKRF